MKEFITILVLSTFFIGSSHSQWTVEYLSVARSQLGSAKTGDVIFFVGGNEESKCSRVIDVYNTSSTTWEQPLFLSAPRAYPAIVAGDSAIYIAGGIESWESKPFTTSNSIDIFRGGIRKTEYFSDHFYGGGALHVGNKIVIAGFRVLDSVTGSHLPSNKVYIYDESTDDWSTETISVARAGMGFATDGVIAVFAGGMNHLNQPTNAVDIYNSANGTWSAANLSEARSLIAGAYSNGRFFFAGGAKAGINNSSNVVDIYDGTTWSVDQLSYPRAGIIACLAGDKVLFIGGGNINMQIGDFTSSSPLVDVFDVINGTWTASKMHFGKVSHTAISNNSLVFVAGGFDFDTHETLSAVEILDIRSSYTVTPTQDSNFDIFSNTNSDSIFISDMNNNLVIYRTEIFNASGIRISVAGNILKGIDISKLNRGIYFLRIIHNEGESVIRFIKE